MKGQWNVLGDIGDIGEKCICPECNYQFGNLKTMDF
jgi:hypothetical protein